VYTDVAVTPVIGEVVLMSNPTGIGCPPKLNNLSILLVYIFGVYARKAPFVPPQFVLVTDVIVTVLDVVIKKFVLFSDRSKSDSIKEYGPPLKPVIMYGFSVNVCDEKVSPEMGVGSCSVGDTQVIVKGGLLAE
jgi:hypothetical protein